MATRCKAVPAVPAPVAIIRRRTPCPGLRATLLIQKQRDHRPTVADRHDRRTPGIADRPLDAGALGRTTCGMSLQPLVDRLVAVLKQSQALHADETPVQRLDPGLGKTWRSYLWASPSDELENPVDVAQQWRDRRRPYTCRQTCLEPMSSLADERADLVQVRAAGRR